VALAEVIPLVRANAPDGAIRDAANGVQAAADNALSDEQIRRSAAAAAASTQRATAVAFYGGLANALGVRIVGVTARPLGPAGAPRMAARPMVGIRVYSDQFVDRNIELISTLRASVGEAVGDAVIRARQFGVVPNGPNLGPNPSAEVLADTLRRVWDQKGVPARIPTRRLTKAGDPVFLSADSHASLIARDQIGKLHGELNRARQEAAGIDRFVWHTQLDDRVRPDHEELEGGIYTWQEGAPGVGIPGEPINCRCWGEPVIDRDQILESGDFVAVDAAPGLTEVDPETFTRRGNPGTEPIDPGPGALL
jgi:SPP1 gp7 family putative phage head morphogenesis protein